VPDAKPLSVLKPTSVLDASALTALIRDEDGSSAVVEADCIEIARLRPITKPQGLSLADRTCLALAGRLGVPALTADRAWADAQVAAEVKLIR
jgi:PIN domain nuclease of toxin-antitoxin system